jgi:hypothetical protein
LKKPINSLATNLTNDHTIHSCVEELKFRVWCSWWSESYHLKLMVKIWWNVHVMPLMWFPKFITLKFEMFSFSLNLFLISYLFAHLPTYFLLLIYISCSFLVLFYFSVESTPPLSHSLCYFIVYNSLDWVGLLIWPIKEDVFDLIVFYWVEYYMYFSYRCG